MTEFKIGDEEYSEETNTSYDQEQPIGDTPNHYPAVGGEPIDAKNGSGFLDVSRLGESEHKCSTDEDGSCSCDTCDYDYSPYGTSCKGCKREKENQWVYGDEKLNKDGTGVARATRGIDPKNTPRKVIMFDYVSKAGCEICSQYDGKSFSIDSPNRPVIPRLESQGKKGTRPYTHPNCKCRWVKVFTENKAVEIEQSTIDRTRKMYGDGFDELTKTQQYIEMIKMIKNNLDKADEGGKGSGRIGHQKWMLEGEANDDCSNCMIKTDRDDDGKCILCGN